MGGQYALYMASVEALAEKMLALPTSGRALLVEKLLASLEGEVDRDVERATLNEIRRRRSAVAEGKAVLTDGPDAMKQARAALRK